MALGIRPTNTEIKGCDTSSPVSMTGVARCEPASLWAAVVPPAPAAEGTARRGPGSYYNCGCAR